MARKTVKSGSASSGSSNGGGGGGGEKVKKQDTPKKKGARKVIRVTFDKSKPLNAFATGAEEGEVLRGIHKDTKGVELR